MRLRTLGAVALGSAALVLATLPSGAASASSPDGRGVSVTAGGLASSSHGGTTSSVPRITKTKCGTSYGTELPTPDGIIAWNDTSGTTFDNAGAADFTCASGTYIHKVKVLGYFGTAPKDTFNVTFYANDSADGTNEPNDAKVLCTRTNVKGAAGGQYPAHQQTTLNLGKGKKGCKVPAGQSWVSVQVNDSAGPWYWEMQVEQQGDAPDWRDVHDVFGSGCTTFDGPAGSPNTNGGDKYLVDCLGYTYGDWMFVLA